MRPMQRSAIDRSGQRRTIFKHRETELPTTTTSIGPRRGPDRAAQPGRDFPGKKEAGDSMVSFWWVLAAFIGGGSAGVLLMAVMHMAGALPEQSAHAPDLNGLPW